MLSIFELEEEHLCAIQQRNNTRSEQYVREPWKATPESSGSPSQLEGLLLSTKLSGAVRTPGIIPSWARFKLTVGIASLRRPQRWWLPLPLHHEHCCLAWIARQRRELDFMWVLRCLGRSKSRYLCWTDASGILHQSVCHVLPGWLQTKCSNLESEKPTLKHGHVPL